MKKLKTLFIEDSLMDANLIKEYLLEAFDLDYKVISNKAQIKEVLDSNQSYDIILSDYTLPEFNAEDVYDLLHEKFSTIPFICISGTIGEEKAVQLLKYGYDDYLLKDRIYRLIPAIKRAIKEKKDDIALEMSYRELEIKNKELQIAKQLAEESSLLKSAFLANMSHEIRTPLNAIIGFSELIINEEDEDLKKSYHAIIDKSGAQLANLINDILDISKIESNNLNLQIEKINLGNLLKNLFISYKNECISNGADLIINYSEYENYYIETDEFRLLQILSNLIKNSIKFTEKGSITLKVEEEQDNLLFSVTDTGIGIDEKHLKVIFNHFRQLESGITKKYKGTGLGLAITKSILEHLGGVIKVKSKLNVGSTFYFTIPQKSKKVYDKISL